MSKPKKTKRHSPSPGRQSKSATRIQAGQNPVPRGVASEHEGEQEAASWSAPVSSSIRDRVLNAAFSLFREHGFSSTSMLDIVTEARISKRDLYALFRNKHEVLAACIGERTERMRRPLAAMICVPQTRDDLTTLLIEFGVSALKTMCHPDALTVFRLAIAESDRAPEVARTLDGSAREANVKALTELIRKAQSQGLVATADPAVLVARFFSALAGDLLIRLLMRVREAPTEREVAARARAAAETLLADR
jgi:AcrR family transcriptional regulator